MHRYGDKGVDWIGISDAAEYIATYLRRFGVAVLDAKEKYGTVRVHIGLQGFYSTEIGFYVFGFIYRRAYRKAVKKWPHLAKELFYGADYGIMLTDWP